MQAGKLRSIQYLRAVAALAVVLHHARNPQPWLYNPLQGVLIGQAGVDIFFVISGFIMYAAARDEPPATFMKRRIARVVPLYWIATLLFVAQFVNVHVDRLTPDFVRRLVLSLAFVPHYVGAEIFPLVGPGWTLNYEMFFYAVFAIGLATRRIVPVVAGTLLVLVAVGLAVRPTEAIARTYTDPLMLEFLAGLAIARWSAKAPPVAGWLLPLGVALLAASAFAALPRVIGWGVPAALIVLGAVTLERTREVPLLAFPKLLGDASYSIYLFQIPALSCGVLIARRLPLTGLPQFCVTIALCLAFAIAIGLLAHRLIERPILRRLAGPRGHGRDRRG